ncbi:MAG: hypothetical protein LBI12_07855 [Treponema sp.]|jgi:hypothetical protein|nr:hypothetical protein [Treponema sp.]
MHNKKKIKISYDLFCSAVSLLEGMDVDYLDSDVMMLYGYVLQAFKSKKAAAQSRFARANLYSASRKLVDFEDYSDNENSYDDDLPF